MRLLKFSVLALFVFAGLGLPGIGVVEGQAPIEAPTGRCNGTNGFVDAATFAVDEAAFRRHYEAAEGLGPCYNAESCSDCHGNPCPGGNSQVNNIQAGNRTGGVFTPHLGGTLIQERAIAWGIQDHLTPADNVISLRMSPLIFGAGYVECIDDQTLIDIWSSEPPFLRGDMVKVPVVEGSGVLRVGRFGWKCVAASLPTMCGMEFTGQIGITNSIAPADTCDPASDTVPDPEDGGDVDLGAFVQFARALKAPGRGPITPAVQAGESLFDQCGCSICHVNRIVTALPGTILNGGTFVVPASLGNRIIHPYSDFLLHDIGTGDGIPTPGVSQTNKIRTAPLWGLILRTRYLHNGLAFSLQQAIAMHNGQALHSRICFNSLPPLLQANVISFLNSL